ncbi:MAG TPA: sulfite exporter TauE/SafE family protein [Rubricoccaceae bacterium]|nr:sulfite exporter TauE/SafE family protein [Rubricoccaceae bacterium]
MDAGTLALLALAGAAGGILVGLVGVGGGIVYAPVLLYTYAALGVDARVLAPLTVGSSLFCVGLAASSGVLAHRKSGLIRWRTALISGAVAAAVLALVGRLITTQSWYDRQVFAVVFSCVLLVVAAQMALRRERPEGSGGPERHSTGALALTGVGAGALAALAGVGGGFVLVPLYHGFLRFPTKAATATSTAAIVLIAAAGVVTYGVLGQGAAVPAGAVGYVDFVRPLALAFPAMATAPLGVWIARRVPVQAVRLVFAAIVTLTAVRLLVDALG